MSGAVGKAVHVQAFEIELQPQVTAGGVPTPEIC